jgi:hypothetical protein
MSRILACGAAGIATGIAQSGVSPDDGCNLRTSAGDEAREPRLDLRLETTEGVGDRGEGNAGDDPGGVGCAVTTAAEETCSPSGPGALISGDCVLRAGAVVV